MFVLSIGRERLIALGLLRGSGGFNYATGSESQGKWDGSDCWGIMNLDERGTTIFFGCTMNTETLGGCGKGAVPALRGNCCAYVA